MRFFIFLTLCCAWLAGCGFTPLYRTQKGNAITIETQHIHVKDLPESTGYLLTKTIRERLNPAQTSAEKKYTLELSSPDIHYGNQSIKSDAFASLEKGRVSVNYTLKDQKGKTLLSSSASGTNTYSIVEDPYASTVAKDRLQNDLILGVGDRIALHIIAYFKNQGSHSESENLSN